MIGSTRYVATAEIARQSQLSADISKLQQSISTNKRLSAGSDDAAGSARISEIRQTQANQVVWTKNVATGTSISSGADTALTSVTNILQRAKELVLSGSNQTNTATDRATYAQELLGLADDLDGLAQSKDANGNALFPAGTPTAIPVSDTLSIAATSSRDTTFDKVDVAAGTKSLSRILRDAATALTSPDEVPATDIDGNPVLDADGVQVIWKREEVVTDSIAEVDVGLEHIRQAQTDQGIRGQRFDDAKDRLSSSGADLKIERSGLEDTDLTYAVSAFQAKDLALKAAQSVYAQAHKQSLFDLLG